MSAISDRAASMILGFEVTDAATYARLYQAPCWPGGDSGVTIGVGYDLGYCTPARLRADWGDRLSAAAITRLAQCCGVHGPQAQRMATALRDLTAPWSAAVAVFLTRTIPATTDQTCRVLPNTDELSPDSLGALVSLVYNRGAGFTLQDDRHAEMRGITAAMRDRRFADIPPLIYAMRRLWLGVPGMGGVVTRREQEAALFRIGLGDAGPASPQPIPPPSPPPVTADALMEAELATLTVSQPH